MGNHESLLSQEGVNVCRDHSMTLLRLRSIQEILPFLDDDASQWTLIYLHMCFLNCAPILGIALPLLKYKIRISETLPSAFDWKHVQDHDFFCSSVSDRSDSSIVAIGFMNTSEPVASTSGETWKDITADLGDLGSRKTHTSLLPISSTSAKLHFIFPGEIHRKTRISKKIWEWRWERNQAR